jgi:hypothetical protein
MRRAIVTGMLVLALGAGACGDDAEQEIAAPAATPAPTPTFDPATAGERAEPTKAALDARPDAALRARLDAGEVAVVDLVGHMGIRPATLEFAKGGRLEGLRWTTWSDREAVGAGTMTGVVCEPTCAQGTKISAPATITLTRPVACPAGRFFDRGRIQVESDDPAAQSTSWLAAPC